MASISNISFISHVPPITNENSDFHDSEVKKKARTFSKDHFLKAATFFQRIHETQIPLKLQYVGSVVGIVGGALSSIDKLNVAANVLLKTIKNVCQVVLSFILKSKFVNHVLNAIKLLPIVAVPLAIYDIILNFGHLIKGSIDQKMDSFLQIVVDIGIMGECVATFAQGLERFGAVSIEAIRWTTPLFAVCLGLSLATMIARAKGWVESTWTLRQLYKKVQSSEMKQIEDYRPLFEYLEKKNNRFLKKQFRVDPIQLRNKIDSVWKCAQEASKKPDASILEKEQTVQQLAKIVKSMRHQSIARIAVQSLMISSCVFAIVSGFVLLFTPAAPVAYGLMAGGVALSLGGAALGAYCNARFRKNLEIKNKSSVEAFVVRNYFWIKNKCTKCGTYAKVVFKKIRRRKKGEPTTPPKTAKQQINSDSHLNLNSLL